ncbi:MAG: gamma-glutamyltransferase [Pseudomonadota bacterium]
MFSIRRLSYLFSMLIAVHSGSALARQAAVAMPDAYSAEAAAAVLASGGNAVDAAITAAFVLAVTYPEAGNIGGGGFMTSVMAGDAAFLDFREQAPGQSHRDMYLDDEGRFVQRLALVGAKASGVPGTVRGMKMAFDRYATRPWAELLAPAITLAQEGFKPSAGLVEMAIDKVSSDAGDTNFAAHFGAMREGTPFAQPQLAETLRRIAQDPEDFYRGKTAGLIVKQMQANGGLINAQDLADYRAQWREPITHPWRGMEIVAAPPPSSGGFALVQLLEMRDLSEAHFKSLAHNSARYIHLLAELEKRVFADRAAYLGDPDFVDNPIEALLAPAYLAMRADAVTPTAISAPESVPAGLESPDTTHFSILDGMGNAVALTYTLNWEFGSGVVIEDAGFLMNNEMDDFSAKPGAVNAFGAVGNERNAIAPGKRMLSSMSPTILTRDGEPAVVVGTPGGTTILTTVFQVLLNLFDFDMAPEDAVNATRFHHQLPQAYLLRHDNRAIDKNTRSALEAMGYRVEANSWGDLGDAQLIVVSPTGVEAAADGRGRGEARVFEAASD